MMDIDIVGPLGSRIRWRAARNWLTFVVETSRLPSMKQGISFRMYVANMKSTPPAMRGKTGTRTNCTAMRIPNRPRNLAAVRIFPEQDSRSAEHATRTISASTRPLRNTLTLVKSRISSLLRGSSLI